MTQPPAISVAEIVRMLSLDARRVVEDCLPDAHVSSVRATCGSLAGEPGQSLSVYLGGEKPGNWKDFQTGERGDILDLVAQCLTQGNKSDAVQWAKAHLGIDGADASRIQVKRREAEKRHRQATKDAERRARQRRRMAWEIWGVEATPDITATPVEHYLATRGIDLERCPSTGAIRYNPEVLYTQDADNASGTFYDAMVSIIVSPAGERLGVHRTYLEQDAGGAWGKADVKRSKKCLGAYEGGYISLCKGASGKPMSGAPEGSSCIVTEGIEDALTLAMAMPDQRIIAGISISNIPNIQFPPAIEQVIFFRDNDVKPDAVRAFKRAVAAMSQRHFTLKIAEVPESKDVNSYLMEHQGAA